MISNEIKEELIKGLQSILKGKLNAIILYGSVARGEATAESDVDIVFIIKSKLDEEEKNNFLDWNAELDLKYDKVFSIVDVEKDLLDKWGAVVPFYRNIKEEGVVLWKAA